MDPELVFIFFEQDDPVKQNNCTQAQLVIFAKLDKWLLDIRNQSEKVKCSAIVFISL
jgi:hypothetical protein